MKIIELEQGSREWFLARAGMATASEFATVLANGRGGSESKSRKTYLYNLAGELLTGEPMESYSNVHMERGKVMEADARNMYALMTNVEPQRIGFVTNGKAGCSPDSFVGDKGMLELKTTLPRLLIEKLFADKFPDEHMAQCQGQLWVCEREWVDLTVFWPKMPLFIKRTYRDEAFIKRLEDEIDRFNLELYHIVEKVRALG